MGGVDERGRGMAIGEVCVLVRKMNDVVVGH